MSFDIVIGDAAQPDTGFDIVIGGAGGGGSMLDVTIPVASLGTVLLILVVRDGEVTCSDAGWTKVIDGEGASGLFLDGWVRTVDGTAGSNAGDVISFLSETEQELQGTVVKSTNADEASLVYDVTHGSFAADATPPAPSIDATQDFDTIVCVWSMADEIAVSVPAGLTEIDSYTSSVVSERTLLVGQSTSGAVGTIVPGDATASPAATGRAFSIVIHHIAEPPGPTLTKMQTGSVSSKWVAAIEGYQYLITDAPTDEALAAWNEYDFTGALGGLYPRLTVDQSISPWAPFENGGGSLTLQVVRADSADTFGVDTHLKSGGTETLADASIDCDDTTVTVKTAASFASSGTIHIGTETATYSGKTGTSFTGLTRGMYSPFLTDDDNNFAHPHSITTDPTAVALLPVVSSTPRQWHGKWVGLWRHLYDAANGLLNYKEDAPCCFAGRIVEVRDNPTTMSTDVEVQHVSEYVRDAVIGEQPWTANLADGVTLAVGQEFRASDTNMTTLAHNPALPFNVVSGAPASVYEIQAGRYTAFEVCSRINTWLAEALADADLTVDMNVGISQPLADGVSYCRLKATTPNTTTGVIYRVRLSLPPTVAALLGFETAPPDGNDVNRLIERGQVEDTTERYWAPDPANRIAGEQMLLKDQSSEFFDQTTSIPTALLNIMPAAALAGEIGLALINDSIAVMISKDGDELISCTPFDIATGQKILPPEIRIPFDEPAQTIRQVVIIRDTFANVIKRLFYSTGTTGHNHATFDVYPSTFSLGIPYDLLGPLFEQSVDNLPHADQEITLVLDKPWKIADLLGGGLMLRFAFLRWIEGHLEFFSWMTPTTGDALEESNKASPAGNQDEQRSVSVLSDRWARNVIKIQYNRDFTLGDSSGSFSGLVTIIDRAGIDDAGGRRAVQTINDQTSFSTGFLGGSGSIEPLINDFKSVVTMFTRPVRTTRRTIAPTFFEGHGVGDCLLVTDAFARDPDTGVRGVSTRPGIMVAHSYEPGGFDPTGAVGDMHGEVEIMFLDLLRVAPYVPAADLASYTHGTATITCTADAYSISGEAADASHMSAGRKLRIVERDPADPAAPLSWDRVVSSQSGNDIVLTSALSSPAFDATKFYRVIWDDYTDAIAAQQAFAYQADDADYRIADSRAPYQYVANASLKDPETATANAPTDAVELPPNSSYGDGVGLDVGHQVAAHRLINNLMDYKTGRSNPVMVRTAIEVSGDLTNEYKLVLVVPIFLTTDGLSNAVRRYLYVAPHWKSLGGATVNARITLGKRLPKGDALEAVTRIPPYGEATFTTTSTSYATPTAVAIEIGGNRDNDGLAYLYLEMQVPTASASEIAMTYGISVCYEGCRVYP